MKEQTVVVIGGGAAGFFGAIKCAESNPSAHVILLEKNKQVLSKVKISGGGRCNVTHACFDPAVLIQNYPRGGKELRGPFTRFQPRDTVEWFEARGVQLKTEADGRMFPVTDQSSTIIECLTKQAALNQVELRTECGVTEFSKVDDQFYLVLSKGDSIACQHVLLATGSGPKTYEWLKAIGHHIVPLVPSLFTLNVPSSPLLELSGIAVPRASVTIEGTPWKQTGPVLMTHWGFSGPAVLKLSAWAARELHACDYRANLIINWLPDLSHEKVKERLLECRVALAHRQIAVEALFDMPRNLWKALTVKAGLSNELRWSGISSALLQNLIKTLTMDRYLIEGKSTYKEEFVTCGGVALEEVNFKTMESRICPGLYFAGEILNIDGVTGGFNFQNAWTTSWLAGQAIASTIP